MYANLLRQKLFHYLTGETRQESLISIVCPSYIFSVVALSSSIALESSAAVIEIGAIETKTVDLVSPLGLSANPENIPNKNIT